MTIRVSIIFVAMLLLAASCKKEDENHLPTKPKLLEPAKGAVIAPEQITFTWEASTDADGEDVYHSLELSSDSSSWQPFVVGKGTSKTIVNKQGESNYFAFTNGKKYFWRVSVNSQDSGGQITGSAESEAYSFYTTPTGLANLSKTSGDGFVNLAWIDPAGLSKVEIIFSPTVSGIAQPIAVNPGVSKVELQGMENSTIYSFYVKAFNSLGHASKVDTIKAMPLSPTLVHDADFNIYTTVKIGTQTWLRENLRTTRWQNGKVMNKDKFGYNLYTIEVKSNIYGYYYNGRVTDNDENPCPCGYHAPTDGDWLTLERYLGMPEEDIAVSSYFFIRGEDEGVGKLLRSTSGWADYNGSSGNGTDLYAFKLLPAGVTSQAGGLTSDGESAWMLVFPHTDGIIRIRIFSNTYQGVRWTNMGTSQHGSIRCVKD
jgi:uncharacterized protein (TIGR02145 family)